MIGIFTSLMEASTSDDEENISPYGPKFIEQFTKGTEYQSGLEYQEDWGWLITVSVPIKNTDGSIIGIVACDFDGAELHRQIVEYSIKQGVVALVCLALGGLLLLFISRLVFTPVALIAGSIAFRRWTNLDGFLHENSCPAFGFCRRG